MRNAAALLFVPMLIIGCTPNIPVKEDFGVSALAPTGDIPPEFAQFNAYDTSAATLLANQTCATPYEKLEDKDIGGEPGSMVLARGRCRTHRPIIGDGDFLPSLIQ